MRPAGDLKYRDRTIDEALTLPKLFLETCRKYWDRKAALREKEFGIWRPITWKDYYERVKHITLGLFSLGLERGDKVAMIGDNRPEGLMVEMAALCAGGIGVWLFQDSLIEEVAYIVDHSDAKFLMAEGQEEVDKALSIRDRCLKLKRVIWDDPKGLRGYEEPLLVNLKEVETQGRKLDEREPGLFEGLIRMGKGSDIALLFYTSGTTALPKGALLTHYNLLTMGQNLMRVDPCFDTDDFVSFLPFAWIGEQMMSISCGLQAGFTINFPEEPETAQENIREVGPQVMFSPPRIYEQMVRSVQVKHLDSSRIKRSIFQWAMDIGTRTADLKFAKKRVPWWLRALESLAYAAVQKKVRDHLGLSRIRHTYTGGAAMGPDHFRFFHSIGVNLKQIYGQTEIAGISVLHRDGDIKFDTVGKPIPGTEIKVTPEGEIISRSSSVFQGYYKMPEETAKALRDGWLHSGDTGFIDNDGHLVVFDRTKDVMILPDNTKFSPQYLETRLKFSPFIRDGWVIGDRRPFVAAVICIDYNVTGKWAEDRNLPYTSYPELSQKPEVTDLVLKEIQKMNKGLPPAARVRRFVNLYKEFDADDDELTRTRKIRRAFVEKRYGQIVEAIYDHQKMVRMDTTITYEDGREVKIQADMRVTDVPAEVA
jgi:long-chain acyl-CoA synthetase